MYAAMRKLGLRAVAVIGAFIVLPSIGRAQIMIDSPLAAIRAFARAMYANDASAFKAMEMPIIELAPSGASSHNLTSR